MVLHPFCEGTQHIYFEPVNHLRRAATLNEQRLIGKRKNRRINAFASKAQRLPKRAR